MVFLVFQKLSCLPYVFAIFFLPVQSLLTCFRSSLTCFADFVSLFSHYNSSSDSKAFLHFIAFSGSPTVFWESGQWEYTVLSFLWCEGMATAVTEWPLHVHYGITLWTYLSVALVKDRHKRLCSMEKTTIPRAHTLLLRTCYGEVYRNIAREENGWLSCGI